MHGKFTLIRTGFHFVIYESHSIPMKIITMTLFGFALSSNYTLTEYLLFPVVSAVSEKYLQRITNYVNIEILL